MGLLYLYYGILGAIVAPLIPLIITALVIHYVGKTLLIGKTEKALADVSARRLNESENSCDGDCGPVFRCGCRPSQVVGVDGKKEKI